MGPAAAVPYPRTRDPASAYVIIATDPSGQNNTRYLITRSAGRPAETHQHILCTRYRNVTCPRGTIISTRRKSPPIRGPRALRSSTWRDSKTLDSAFDSHETRLNMIDTDLRRTRCVIKLSEWFSLICTYTRGTVKCSRLIEFSFLAFDSTSIQQMDL